VAAPAPDPRSAEASALLRAALDDARAQMRTALAGGASGADVCAALSDVYDRAVSARWRTAAAGVDAPLALVATGGWGRRELAPYSDIDFILLHRGDERAAKQVADRLLYPLWDAKVAVGHAIREPRATARLARDDLATATALLDVRHLAGDPALTEELVRATRATIAPGGNANAFVAELAAEKKRRHDRFGDSLYLLEPNLKQGIGALRDLATALWAAAARWNPSASPPPLRARGLTDDTEDVVRAPGTALAADVLIESLVAMGHLTRRQAQVLHGARDMLLRVRAMAQLTVERRTDQLTFEIQEAIAPPLFPDARLAVGDVRPAVAPAVEALMRSYYLHARGVVQVADRLLESARVPERRKPRIARLDQTFITWNGEVAVSDPRVFAERPAEMLRIFRVAVAEGLEVYGHTRELIAEQVAAGGTALTGDPTAARHFLDALVDIRDKGQPSALEVMHQLGLLNAVMPEWAPCTGRVQHDLYHVYTVDQHQLYAVAMLKRIARGELAEEQAVATTAYRDVRRHHALYLGTLLHDVGKPMGKGHAEKGAVLTASIARRLGLSEADAQLAELLVRQHLTMAHLSQRRDLADPDVVQRFADRIGDEETLRTLYLLTLCDTAMTNPDNLSAWKDTLMRELFVRARDVLRAGGGNKVDTASEQARQSRERVLQLADADGLDVDEVARFVDGLDPRFLTQLTPRQTARHVKLALRQRAAHSVADLAVSHYPLKGHSEVAVIAPDVPGALAAIAGAFTANRVDVLGAVVGHADDGRGLALDLFFVRDLVGSAIPEDDPRWRRLEEDLRALFGKGAPDPAAIDALIARRRPPSGLPPRFTPAVPTEIKVLNDDSEKATIVEVFTRDRVGVLYAITHTLAELGLDISLSKVSTEGEKVADVFYVTRGGAKITDGEEIAALVARLHQELEAP
jgi:[protein-PII] uridylyltransferase